jgi:hypothetical protein
MVIKATANGWNENRRPDTMGDSEKSGGTPAATTTVRFADFAFRRRAIHAHGHTQTAKSDESGTSRDESGTSRDESTGGWDETAAKATGTMLSPRSNPRV